MKYITLILVPHMRARYRKITIPIKVLWSIGISLFLFFFLTIYVTYHYLSFQKNQYRLAKISKENQALKTQVARYQSELASLEKNLERLENQAEKLAMIQGLGSPAQLDQGGVGGLEHYDIPAVSWKDRLNFRQNRLFNLLNKISNAQNKEISLLRSTPSLAPVRGFITTGYQWRLDPFTKKREFHPAVDISAPMGNPVVASADGLVVQAGRSGGYGLVVMISHALGFQTRYAHLSQITVKPGMRVKRGDIIGKVGTTGRSTGPHLHYEVYLEGKPVNPLAYLLNF